MNLDLAAATRVLKDVLPGQAVSRVDPFREGVTNCTYKITFAAHPPVVLRFYRDSRSFEAEVLALRGLHEAAPAPALLHVDATGSRGIPPFVVLEHIEGVTFREFRRSANASTISDVAYEIGRTLASLHAAVPATSGMPARQPAPGDLPMLMAEMQRSPVLLGRIGSEISEGANGLVAKRQYELEKLQACFTHGDFNNRNVLVRYEGGEWRLAAIVDWECAGSAPALYDIARFLQYESRSSPSREPGFSQGYVAGGGVLPADWWSLARTVNLFFQCQLLSDPDLPMDIVQEVKTLVQTTISESASAAGA